MKTKKRKILEAIFSAFLTLIISIALAMKMKYEQTGKAFVPETFLAASTIFIMAISIALVGRKFILHFKYKSKKLLQKQIIPALILFFAIIQLIAHLTITVGVFLWYLKKGLELDNFIYNLFHYELPRASKSMVIPMILATLILFYMLWRKAIKREEQLEQEKLKFQYKTLKNQVNPHFLFNSLNTLSSLITSDTEAADDFVNKLSDTYRYIVDNEEKATISLKEELDFVKDYFALQKIRDNGKIDLNIQIDNPSLYEIIPVSLQTLIENALKHNGATMAKPLKITISKENDFVVVKNNLQPKTKLEKKTGTGLQNLKERVQLATLKEIIIQQDDETFRVKIPIFER